jgi:hypothetical protein
MDKILSKNDEIKDDIQEQINLLNKSNPETIEDILKLNNDLLLNEQEQKKILQDNIASLTEQRDSLEIGSYEWNLVNDQISTYNEQLEDANKSILDQITNIRNIEANAVIDDLNDSLNTFTQTVSNLQKQLDLLKTWKPEDYNSISALMNNIISANTSELTTLQSNIDQLLYKRNQAIGEEEWKLWNDQLEKAYTREANLIQENANLRKELLQTEFNQQNKELEKILFGEDLEDIQDRIEQQKEYYDTYFEGEEKAYTLSQLRVQLNKDLRDNGLSEQDLNYFNQKIDLMEVASKITKDEYETLKKELAIKEAQYKLDNLMKQKTIQQLTKLEDGTWDYVYVANQDEIDKAQNELDEAKIDWIKWNRDLGLKQQQEEIDNKKEYYDDILEIQQNALDGQYENQAEFEQAIDKLNSKLGTKYKGTWTSIVQSQLVANGQLSTYFSEMKNSYSTFTTDMINFTEQLSTTLQNSANAMTTAVESMADAIERLVNLQSQQGAVQAQQNRANNSYDEQAAEMEQNNAGGNIPNVNTNKVWNVGYPSAQNEIPNVVVTDENGNTIPVTVTRTNANNFAVTPVNPYKTGKVYTLKVGSTIQKFTTSPTGSYSEGGVIDYSGIAQVHGSSNSPEVMFNSSQASKLYEIVKNLPKFDINKYISNIKLPDFSKLAGSKTEGRTEQHFHINKLEFPNVRDSKDIENAILNLPRIAIQYAK